MKDNEQPHLAENGLLQENMNKKDIRQRITDFVAHTEVAQQQMLPTEGFQKRLQVQAQHLQQQFNNIAVEINHAQHIMSHAGAVQWLNQTEAILAQEKTEIKQLNNIYQNMYSTIQERCEYLNNASVNTVKNIARVVSASHMHSHELTKLAAEKADELRAACQNSLQRVDKVAHTFQWRNFIMIFLLAAVVSIIVSLYVDDEWPWQTHERIIEQREMGKVLLSSWSQLSHPDQLEIDRQTA